jgi:hypothetical protein
MSSTRPTPMAIVRENAAGGAWDVDTAARHDQTAAQPGRPVCTVLDAIGNATPMWSRS